MNNPSSLTTPTPQSKTPPGPGSIKDEVPFIETIELHKSYVLGPRRLEVLRGVSFRMQRGELLALRGASGAGKSTLLHLLGGLDNPNQGQIRLAGQDLTRLSKSALAEFRNRRVGFIFQAYHLMPELDALENVCLPGRIARRPSRLVERQARELLARVGLGNRMDHKAFELSGGEQQRVALARALINEPDLILADEPTGNLDSRTGEEIIELLCQLRVEKETTLIIATHDPHVAARAPRVLELVDGHLV
jgi:lipoprotein-releasing system ATP-binding protein